MEEKRYYTKCNRSMKDNEGFCTNCSVLSGTIQKGTLLIRASNIIPVGIISIILGISICTLIVVLSLKGISLGRLTGGLFTIGFVPILIGSIMIIKWRQSINMKKAETINNLNSRYCRYCHSTIDEESRYCSFCGSMNRAK